MHISTSCFLTIALLSLPHSSFDFIFGLWLRQCVHILVPPFVFSFDFFVARLFMLLLLSFVFQSATRTRVTLTYTPNKVDISTNSIYSSPSPPSLGLVYVHFHVHFIFNPTSIFKWCVECQTNVEMYEPISWFHNHTHSRTGTCQHLLHSFTLELQCRVWILICEISSSAIGNVFRCLVPLGQISQHEQ